MAKKKRRKQKQVNPQTPPLEALLRSGEAVLYGQVCWSIANRDTELPRTGEVIILERGMKMGATATGHSTLPARASRTSNGAWD